MKTLEQSIKSSTKDSVWLSVLSPTRDFVMTSVGVDARDVVWHSIMCRVWDTTQGHGSVEHSMWDSVIKNIADRNENT